MIESFILIAANPLFLNLHNHKHCYQPAYYFKFARQKYLYPQAVSHKHVKDKFCDNRKNAELGEMSPLYTFFKDMASLSTKEI